MYHAGPYTSLRVSRPINISRLRLCRYFLFASLWQKWQLRALGRQGARPHLHMRIDSTLSGDFSDNRSSIDEVINHESEGAYVVLDHAKSRIASAAEPATELARFMVMIKVKSALPWPTAANLADIWLGPTGDFCPPVTGRPIFLGCFIKCRCPTFIGTGHLTDGTG